jgi:LacI family transcriptional regulator
MNNNKLNIKEFSKLLGVSTATVSRAFSGKGRISEKTRDFIMEKAEELGYRANANARNLILRRSDTIAFFYPSLYSQEPDYFITEIMFGANAIASENMKQLQIHPIHTDRPANNCKEILLNGSIAGIIVLAGTEISVELVKTAARIGLPCVVIGYMKGENINRVIFKLQDGARKVGEYFSKTGRHNPAYVGGMLDKRKRLGYAMGLKRQEDEIVFDPGGCTYMDGSLAFDRVVNKHPDVDCVFCANDTLAIGFIKRAIETGKKIPEDIAVIGCDDIRISRYYSPALSTLSLNLYALGSKAVKQLEKLINGEKLLNDEVIDPELIIRDSA